MAETAQIHLQVRESTKQEWKEAAGEHPEIPNNNLSQLIRHAVNHEIGDGKGSDRGRVDGELDRIADRQGELLDGVGRLTSTIERLEERLSKVERVTEQHASQETLRNKVWNVLPPKPYTEHWERARTAREDRDGETVVAWEGTIESIAEVVDVREEVVETALAAVLENRNTRTGEIRGERRFWVGE